MAYFYISVSDLLLLEDYRKAAKENNKREMYRILYLHGLDIKKPFEYEYCIHRNWQNKIVTGDRVFGVERSDDNWLLSPYASDQVKSEKTGDGSLLRHIDKLSRSGIVSAESMFDSKDYT